MLLSRPDHVDALSTKCGDCSALTAAGTVPQAGEPLLKMMEPAIGAKATIEAAKLGPFHFA